MQIIIISSKNNSMPNISNIGRLLSLRASGWKLSGPREVGKKPKILFKIGI